MNTIKRDTIRRIEKMIKTKIRQMPGHAKAKVRVCAGLRCCPAGELVANVNRYAPGADFEDRVELKDVNGYLISDEQGIDLELDLCINFGPDDIGDDFCNASCHIDPVNGGFILKMGL